VAGQDAVNAARAFGAALDLTGIVLTKADGDARGGAALSVRRVTGQPILFVGVGEKPDALEAFQPERMASRILGMGDVLRPGRGSDPQGPTASRPRKLARQGRRRAAASTLTTCFRTSCASSRAWAEMAALDGQAARTTRGKGPGALPQGNERDIKRPDRHHLLDDPRRTALPEAHRRLATATDRGRLRDQVSDVNRLLKNFLQMQKMMKGMGKGGAACGDGAVAAGRLPPGLR